LGRLATGTVAQPSRLEHMPPPLGREPPGRLTGDAGGDAPARGAAVGARVGAVARPAATTFRPTYVVSPHPSSYPNSTLLVKVSPRRTSVERRCSSKSIIASRSLSYTVPSVRE
jgi:hypothetical protein